MAFPGYVFAAPSIRASTFVRHHDSRRGLDDPAAPGASGATGGTVVQGSAGISQTGSTTNINQSSNKAIINWQGFSIGLWRDRQFQPAERGFGDAQPRHRQRDQHHLGRAQRQRPGLHRQFGGVLFSKGSQVNVGGLVASTLDISNTNFMAGKYTFSGSSAALRRQSGLHPCEPGRLCLAGLARRSRTTA